MPCHFPLSWPYFNISPLLEPTLSFLGGYASYYVLTGLGLLSLHRRFVEPRIRHGSWLDRHRFVAVFITGFIAGLALNALMQLMWVKVGLFVYTQAAGPVLHIWDRHLPLYMVIYDSVLFAIVALLCVRDDNGRPAIVVKLAQNLPAIGSRVTTPRLQIIATATLMSAVLLPIAVFSLLRIGGDPKPAYDVWPYPPSRSTTPTATWNGPVSQDRSIGSDRGGKMTEGKHRVVVWSTGGIGSIAIRAIHRRPNLGRHRR